MKSSFFEQNGRGEKEVNSDSSFYWLDHFQSVALITDKSGKILQANSAFYKLTALNPESIVNSGLSEIVIPDPQISSPDKFTGNDLKLTVLLRINSGKSIRCNFTKENIKSEAGHDYDLIHLYPETKSVASGEFENRNPDESGFSSNSSNQASDINFFNKSILETIPDLLILFDNQANIIEINENPNFPIPYLGRLIRNENLKDILPGRSSDLLDKFREASQSGRPQFLYHEIEYGGFDRQIEYRLVSVDDNRILAIVRDITDLKKSEEALIMSQERLKHLQQVSGIGSWDAAFNGKAVILTWNFFEILGLELPVRELTTDDINHFEIIHPDDLDSYKKLVTEAKENKQESYRTEYRIIDRKNNIRHLYTEAKLEYDNGGKLIRWVGTVHDISIRKIAEVLKASAFQISQLIHSQHNLTHLMQAIHQIIGTLMPAPNLLVALSSDGENKITFPYCIDPAGVPDQETANKGLIGYVLGSGQPLLVSSKAIDLMIGEKIILKPARVPESWLGVPLKTHDKVLGVLVLQSYTPDITYGEEEKNILIFVSEQIALSIQRIGSDLELMNAKNEAEESSRLKSSLLANMSHELRTPMTGILGFSEILQEELEDERLRVMASTIYKSANRLMSTLNSIMDLSAIESNIDSLKIRPVGVKSVFLPLLRNLHSIAGDKGLYLRTALPPTINVLADEKLLGQLLHHLLDNAIKFTIDGGISVSAFINDKNKSEAIIRISDTGIGIAPEHHKLIFEEFRQVSEGLSRTFEGSGLGLALCVKIARLINARLWVDSIPEKGSDFYIALPYVLPDTFEAIPEQEPDNAINTRRLSRGPVPEVLIVEDNEINRRLAALYLRELCNTEMAENGYVALEKIKRKTYDAILMDINLGAGPNGMSIATHVRSLDNYKNTPIIAVTGYTMQGDREKLLSNGCSHYLAKPYDKKTILRLFSEILYQ